MSDRAKELVEAFEAQRAEATTVPPFPLDALPAPCARLARELAAAVPCPPDFVGVPLLAVASAAIGASRRLRIKPGHHEEARLLTATCGRPGSGKSPGFREALRPAWAWQAEALAACQAERVEYARTQEEHEAARERWKITARKGTGGGAPPEPPAPPVLARLVAEDVTVEALAPCLEENPRGLIVACDELAGWVNAIGQYKSGRNADRARWLTLWTGSPLTVDRKGSEPIMVPRPFVCVTGGLQPDALSILVGEGGADDGFPDRVLVSYPDPVPLVPGDESGVSDAMRAGWAGIFARLRELRAAADEPVTVTLDAGASAGWRAWRGALLAERNGAPDHLAGPLAKLDAHAARLVLVAHELRRAAGEGGSPERVDAESLRRGLALADYFRGHFGRVYTRVDDARASAARRPGARGPAPERRAELAARASAELGRVSPRSLADLARAVGVDPTNRTLRDALAELVEQGRVVRTDEGYALPPPRNPTQLDTPDTPHDARAVAGCRDSRVSNEGAAHKGDVGSVPHVEAEAAEAPDWRDEVPDGLNPERPFAEPAAVDNGSGTHDQDALFGDPGTEAPALLDAAAAPEEEW